MVQDNLRDILHSIGATYVGTVTVMQFLNIKTAAQGQA
jgi:hypothetical protein